MRTFVTDRLTDGADYIGPEAGPKRRFLATFDFKSAQERKFFEDKYVCLLGTLGPNNGLNHMAQLGSYAKEMYSMYNDFLGSHHE